MRTAPSGRAALPYLRDWRNTRMLTIRQLAKASGVATRTINTLELGRRQANFATVGRLAQALGLTPQQLAYIPPDQLPPEPATH